MHYKQLFSEPSCKKGIGKWRKSLFIDGYLHAYRNELDQTSSICFGFVGMWYWLINFAANDLNRRQFVLGTRTIHATNEIEASNSSSAPSTRTGDSALGPVAIVNLLSHPILHFLLVHKQNSGKRGTFVFLIFFYRHICEWLVVACEQRFSWKQCQPAFSATVNAHVGPRFLERLWVSQNQFRLNGGSQCLLKNSTCARVIHRERDSTSLMKNICLLLLCFTNAYWTLYQEHDCFVLC